MYKALLAAPFLRHWTAAPSTGVSGSLIAIFIKKGDSAPTVVYDFVDGRGGVHARKF
jgi:hypothetical protein